MTTIYRIQNAQGRGPYQPGFSETWVDPDNDGANCPGEFPAPILMNLVVVARKKGFGVCFGFGFRTLEQLNHWFTKTEQARLVRYGFKIVEMEADAIIGETDHQLLFARKLPLKCGFKPVGDEMRTSATS